MAKYTQDGRQLSITTPLGKDALLLESVRGAEGVSRLFRYEADALSEKDSLDTNSLLGKKVTLQFSAETGVRRYVNGTVQRFRQAGQTKSIQGKEVLTRYRLVIVPDLWLLTCVFRSRIFQQKSVKDILKVVFTGLDVSDKLQKTYNPRDYCVQYRESDFAFASRLMEEEGIFYFFKHTTSGNQLVLGDSTDAYAEIADPSSITLFRVEGGMHKADEIMDWDQGAELRSNKITLWDYSFEMPEKNLEATKDGKASKVMEIYEYPGSYAKRYDGVDPTGSDKASDLQKIFKDNLAAAEVRLQEEVSASHAIGGTGNVRHFVAGHTFTLQEHFNAAANIAFLLTSVETECRLDGVYSASSTEGFSFRNKFQCIPASVVFRPGRTTAKPVIAGPQTATVVGPQGQEIFTDKYSRVKVQFHWDRDGKNDAKSSCWVRVGTPWAGQQWGMIHIPRIGHEVIVAFEDGDPDQPLIVGSVYNAKNMPPYKLPDNMTQSGLKTRSSTKGTADNYNELRFEDKKGSEQVYFHAEKNYDRVVENNDTLKVGSNKADDGSQTIEIWKNRTETIKEGDEKVTLEKGSRTHKIKKDDTLTIDTGNRTETISQGNDSLTVSQGNRSVTVSQGTDTLEAGKSITLKVGSCSIVIDTSGITIKAPQITVQGSTTVEVKSPSTTVSGDTTLVLKGGQVAIN